MKFEKLNLNSILTPFLKKLDISISPLRPTQKRQSRKKEQRNHERTRNGNHHQNTKLLQCTNNTHIQEESSYKRC